MSSPQPSPELRLLPPVKYLGEPGAYHAFLMQYKLIIQPHTLPTEAGQKKWAKPKMAKY